MKMIRYATARLIYYKKQTILYCLFSSFSAFLLIACLTLYQFAIGFSESSPEIGFHLLVLLHLRSFFRL